MTSRHRPLRFHPATVITACVLTLLARPGVTASTCGSLRGDCNGDGRVSIGELQRAAAMREGSQAPACGVDADGNGAVSDAELQAVVDSFLGVRVAAAVAIDPISAIVATGGALSFTAAALGCGDEPAVSWSVQEPEGGSISAGGTYSAPAAPGTYHVVATVLGDSSVSATAAVVVVSETTLAEQSVAPSGSDQTVSVPGKVSATIGGGLLSEAVTVRIAEVSGVSTPAGYTPLTPWYRVTVNGEAPPFPLPVTLLQPAGGAAPLRAAAGETVVIEQTPEGVYEVPAATASGGSGHRAAAQAGLTVHNTGTPVCLSSGPTGATMNQYDTANFRIIYYTDNLYAVPTDAEYAAENRSNPLLPDFVEDVAVFLERAHSHYVDTLKLRPPVRPEGESRIFVQIRNYKESEWLPRTRALHIANNFAAASLLGFNWHGDDRTLLAHELAHELFHALQNAYLGYVSMYQVQWLTESLADYAAHLVTPRSQELLDVKLVNFGDWLRLVYWDARNEEMQYLGASWLDYMAEHNGFALSPKFMEQEYSAIPSGAFGGQNAIDFLLGEHPFMKLLYGDWVRYFYFHEKSALAKTYFPYIKKNPRSLRFRNELASAANRWPYEDEKGSEKTFTLGGYPGGVMSLTADYVAVFPARKSVIPSDPRTRAFTVAMLTDLNPGELAILYRGKEGRPIDAGEEMPSKGTVRSLKLGSKETADSFWVLLVNPNESAAGQTRHQVRVQQLYIDSLTPNRGVVGSEVIIRGHGFGATQGTSQVLFSGVPATVARAADWSDTEIKVTVPDDAPGDSKVSVRVDGADSNEAAFTVTLAVSLSFTCNRIDMCTEPRPTQITTWTATVTSPSKSPLHYAWTKSWAGPPGSDQPTFQADTTACPRNADCVMSACSLSGLTVEVTVTDALGRTGSRWDNWGGAY